ncbi:hypothetical protein [Ruicaihuangia caeni]|uniref:DUF559 domain-containing protein n=1 Tax=Ruicaihuangia caeni TaxID=3042517 RepID=A0AAW6TDL5_9MICO|nr:hypothetical protein [Klugiella sp. YN-L-19]MDI2099657.1 hypothetical protein [Klugiella sp. YN-L-19]
MPRPSLSQEFTSRPFSVAEAIQAGIRPSTLRSARFARPFSGVRMLGASDMYDEAFTHLGFADDGDSAWSRSYGSFVALCRAYHARMPQHAFFSHATAARLHGMWLPGWLIVEPVLHVSVLAPHALPRASGIVGHRSLGSRVRVTQAEALPALAAEEVWVQLAARLRLDDLVAAGDWFVRRKGGSASLESLSKRVAAAGGARGVRVARESLALIRPGVDSPQESKLRVLIVQAGLPEPIVGFVVRDRSGQFIATPDLAYPDARIALEYEGDGHRLSRQQFVIDIDRYERLAAAGWRVIRVLAQDLGEPHSRVLISRLGAALLHPFPGLR